MALIECEECGNQVSDKAKSCPNCGFEKKSFTQSLDDAGNKMQKAGCMMTLFITIPILLFMMGGC